MASLAVDPTAVNGFCVQALHRPKLSNFVAAVHVFVIPAPFRGKSSAFIAEILHPTIQSSCYSNATSANSLFFSLKFDP
ncbi:hypothetical protein SDJN02_07568, partial [Cucurbita argyrosperma subsp. argyrosperma]